MVITTLEKNEIVSILITDIKPSSSISFSTLLSMCWELLKEFSIYSKLELGKALNHGLLRDMKENGLLIGKS